HRFDPETVRLLGLAFEITRAALKTKDEAVKQGNSAQADRVCQAGRARPGATFGSCVGADQRPRLGSLASLYACAPPVELSILANIASETTTLTIHIRAGVICFEPSRRCDKYVCF